MKKTLLIIAALVGTLAFAEETTLRITITGDNYPTLSTDYVYLMQSDDYSAAQDQSDIIKMWNGDTKVNVWAISPLGQLSTMQTNNLSGTFIGIHSNINTSYTMSFDWIAGETLTIIDHSNDSIIKATAESTYHFSVPAAQTTYANRFEIVVPEFKVCVTFDQIEIYNNTGADNIVVTNAAGVTVVDVAPTLFQSIDLSDKPAGHYVLTVNGESFEFYNKPEAD